MPQPEPYPEEEAPTGPLAGIFPPPQLNLSPPSDEQEEKAAPVQVAFRTCLKLTPAQEARLIKYADERIDEVMKEMGMEPDYSVREDSFLGIRKRNLDSYDNDLTWRTALDQSIFTKSNLSLGTNTRHVRYISSRVQDDLLGTEPFFAAMGRKPDKEKLAKQAEQYIQDRIDRSKVRAGLRRAQKAALIVNESVVKTSWVINKSPYIGPAKVFVSAPGQPIKTDKGYYIYENDNFLPAPIVEPGPDGNPQLVILEKDPSFTMKPGQYETEQFDDLPQSLVLYEGPKAEPLDSRSFLCPLRVPSVHEADINVHLYRETPLRLKELYGAGDIGVRYFAAADEFPGDKQPKTSQGEREDAFSSVYEQTTVGEVFVRFDADEDGVAEEIWLIMDRESTRRQKAVFYDYLANHYGKRPFEVIPGIEQVANRWYGRGIFSLNYDQELHIDAEFNRAQVKGSRSSSVTFRQRGACEEWDAGQPVEIGGESVLTCSQNFDAEKNPPIFKINLAEQNEQSIELMEISRQAADAKVGAISVKDASESQLNQSKTATGIVNLQAASDVITKATEQEHMESIEAILDQVIDLTFEKMDVTVLMLDKDATELVTLNREEIRSLGKDVRLTLTKSRSTQMQAVSEKAIMIVKDYRQMMLTDPDGAKMIRSFYIDQLKALEVNDADEVCPEITDEMLAQFQQQQAPQQPPSKSISAKLTDLAPSERAQVLQSEGITPASPAELAAEEQKQQQAKQQEAALKRPNEPSKPSQPHGKQQ